jgi:hypothetical protein
MVDRIRRLKANKTFEDKACGHCGVLTKFGEDLVLCEACNRPHHASCWDQAGGCSTPECENAPLAQLDETVSPGPPPPGAMQCPHCEALLDAGSVFCSECGRATTYDGVYRGPKKNAPGAIGSLVTGILGLCFCGIILGPIAIHLANEAKKVIAYNPTFKGGGLATAGKTLGIIALILWGFGLLAKLGTFQQ